MLQNKTNMNRENINAKYGLAFDPAVSLIIFATKLNESSEISCSLLGTILFSLVEDRNLGFRF